MTWSRHQSIAPSSCFRFPTPTRTSTSSRWKSGRRSRLGTASTYFLSVESIVSPSVCTFATAARRARSTCVSPFPVAFAARRRALSSSSWALSTVGIGNTPPYRGRRIKASSASDRAHEPGGYRQREEEEQRDAADPREEVARDELTAVQRLPLLVEEGVQVQDGGVRHEGDAEQDEEAEDPRDPDEPLERLQDPFEDLRPLRPPVHRALDLQAQEEHEPRPHGLSQRDRDQRGGEQGEASGCEREDEGDLDRDWQDDRDRDGKAKDDQEVNERVRQELAEDLLEGGHGTARPPDGPYKKGIREFPCAKLMRSRRTSRRAPRGRCGAAGRRA